MSEGQVIEAMAWPDDPAWRSPIPVEAGSIRLAMGQGQNGKVRARIEAPVQATLQWQFGDQAVKLPVSALLDGPQKLSQAGIVDIEVGRVAWDPLEVRLGDGSVEGVLPPGSNVPLLIGTNLLTPEPGEVTVVLTAELRPIRGGDPVWKLDRQEFNVSTNGAFPGPDDAGPACGRNVRAGRPSATWTPAESAEGSRLARWLRRRRPADPSTSSTASRRLTLVAMGPLNAPPEPPSGSLPADSKADQYDLSRWRSGSRPLASGRAPGPTAIRARWARRPATLRPGRGPCPRGPG
ncbi:MAG: hypothetical protein U0800_01065 [Isosphaeraceae bacterium]